jgi:hypothetical protein
MSRGNLKNDSPDPRQQTWSDQDGIPAEPDLAGSDRLAGLAGLGGARLAAAYQVTSPAPERTFATRASMKRRSESRLR